MTMCEMGCCGCVIGDGEVFSIVVGIDHPFMSAVVVVVVIRVMTMMISMMTIATMMTMLMTRTMMIMLTTTM